MRIECESCKAVYNIDDALLSDQPIGAQCPYCSHVKVVSRQSGLAPEPAGLTVEPARGRGRGTESAEDRGLYGGGGFQAGVAPSSGIELDDGGGRSFGAPGIELDTEAKCNVCGAPLRDEFDKVIGLCETHQRERAGGGGGAGPGLRFRVRKKSGEVIGPFTFDELTDKARSRDVVPEDRFSTDEDPSFKEARQIPQIKNLFEVAAELAAKPKLKPQRPPRNYGFLSWILLFIAVASAGGAVLYFVAPETALAWVAKLRSGGSGGMLSRGSPLGPRISDLKSKHGKVDQTVEDLRRQAARGFALDTQGGYEEARTSLEKALVLAPSDPELAAEYVENEIVSRGQALTGEERDLVSSVADWVVKKAPDRSAGHRARAAYLLLVGELDEARTAAEQALKRDASDIRAKLLLAEAFVEGNYDLAMVEAEAAASAAPELRRVDRVLARAYQLAGRYSSAYKVLETRLAKDGNNAAVLTLYGDLERALGQLGNAEARLRSAVAGKGAVNEARLALGGLLLERESFDAAAAIYRRLAEDATQPSAHRRAAYAGWARAELLRKQYKRADRLAQAALALGTRDPVALLVRAEAALETGSATTAEAMAKRTLDLQRGEPAALVVLGRLAARAGNLPDAVKHLEEACQNDARDPKLWSVLAATYLKFNSDVQAFTIMRKVVEIDPAERDARNRQSLLAVSPFAIREAVATFEEHLKQDRNRSLSHAAIGVLEYHAGRTAAARDAFVRAIRGDSGNVLALLYDAHLAFERGEPARAQKALERVLKVEKTSLIGNLIAARAATERRDLAGAKEHLDVALRTSRGFAPAVVEQAYMEFARNDKEAAQKLVQEVYRVNPYSMRTRRLLRKLEV